MENTYRKVGVCFKKNKRIMERIIELLEEIIDDIERDPEITKTLILEALYKVKEEAEDINLQEENY